MNSTMCIGTSSDFILYLKMALQKRLPWKTLAIIFTDVAPTLSETREIITILLKELETLHLALLPKQTELKEYQDKNQTVLDTENSIRDSLSENEMIANNKVMELFAKDDNKPDFLKEIENDNVEVLEVVKERMEEEMSIELNEGNIIEDKRQVSENDEHDSGKK